MSTGAHINEMANGRHVKTQLPPGVNASANSPEPLATFLGMFSLALGAAELAAPRGVARLTGARKNPFLLRAYGLREIAAGVGILTNQRPGPWLWSRVAGDAIDLATLASAYSEGSRRDRQRVMISAAAVAGVTLLDVICARKHT